MERSKEFFIIGLGQGGGRLAETFSRKGYPAVAINTASQDLDALPLPAADKLLIEYGDGGAGKDIGKGADAFRSYKHEVLDFIETRCAAPETAQYVVCVGAGGGSGTGGLGVVLPRIKEKIHAGPISLLLTLPLDSEGEHVRANASVAIGQVKEYLDDGLIQTLVLIDNNRVKHLVGKVSLLALWKRINEPIIELWDKFNRLSAQPSDWALDPTDYMNTINAGGCLIMGRTSVTDKRRGAVAEAMEVNLDRGMLAQGFDLKDAKAAAAILCGDESALDIDADALEYLRESMIEQIGGVLHTGVYVTEDTELTVYTMVGGLALPRGLLEG